MAWSNSKVMAAFVGAALDRSVAFDLDGDTHKVALYNNSITPDNTVSLANSAYNVGQWATANEVYEAGQWAQAGVALSGHYVDQTQAIITFDANDTASGSAADLANVYGCLVYDDTVTGYGLSYNYLGGANSVTNGTFTVVWSGSGILSFSVA